MLWWFNMLITKIHNLNLHPWEWCFFFFSIYPYFGFYHVSSFKWNLLTFECIGNFHIQLWKPPSTKSSTVSNLTCTSSPHIPFPIEFPFITQYISSIIFFSINIYLKKGQSSNITIRASFAWKNDSLIYIHFLYHIFP